MSLLYPLTMPETSMCAAMGSFINPKRKHLLRGRLHEIELREVRSDRSLGEPITVFVGGVVSGCVTLPRSESRGIDQGSEVDRILLLTTDSQQINEDSNITITVAELNDRCFLRECYSFVPRVKYPASCRLPNAISYNPTTSIAAIGFKGDGVALFNTRTGHTKWLDLCTETKIEICKQFFPCWLPSGELAVTYRDEKLRIVIVDTLGHALRAACVPSSDTETEAVSDFITPRGLFAVTPSVVFLLAYNSMLILMLSKTGDSTMITASKVIETSANLELITLVQLEDPRQFWAASRMRHYLNRSELEILSIDPDTLSISTTEPYYTPEDLDGIKDLGTFAPGERLVCASHHTDESSVASLSVETGIIEGWNDASTKFGTPQSIWHRYDQNTSSSNFTVIERDITGSCRTTIYKRECVYNYVGGITLGRGTIEKMIPLADDVLVISTHLQSRVLKLDSAGNFSSFTPPGWALNEPTLAATPTIQITTSYIRSSSYVFRLNQGVVNAHIATDTSYVDIVYESGVICRYSLGSKPLLESENQSKIPSKYMSATDDVACTESFAQYLNSDEMSNSFAVHSILAWNSIIIIGSFDGLVNIAPEEGATETCKIGCGPVRLWKCAHSIPGVPNIVAVASCDGKNFAISKDIIKLTYSVEPMLGLSGHLDAVVVLGGKLLVANRSSGVELVCTNMAPYLKDRHSDIESIDWTTRNCIDTEKGIWYYFVINVLTAKPLALICCRLKSNSALNRESSASWGPPEDFYLSPVDSIGPQSPYLIQPIGVSMDGTFPGRIDLLLAIARVGTDTNIYLWSLRGEIRENITTATVPEDRLQFVAFTAPAGIVNEAVLVSGGVSGYAVMQVGEDLTIEVSQNCEWQLPEDPNILQIDNGGSSQDVLAVIAKCADNNKMLIAVDLKSGRQYARAVASKAVLLNVTARHLLLQEGTQLCDILLTAAGFEVLTSLECADAIVCESPLDSRQRGAYAGDKLATAVMADLFLMQRDGVILHFLRLKDSKLREELSSIQQAALDIFALDSPILTEKYRNQIERTKRGEEKQNSIDGRLLKLVFELRNRDHIFEAANISFERGEAIRRAFGLVTR